MHALKESADAKSDAIIDPESGTLPCVCVVIGDIIWMSVYSLVFAFLFAAWLDLYRLLYELIWVVVHAKLTRHDVVSVLKEAELVRIHGVISYGKDMTCC